MTITEAGKLMEVSPPLSVEKAQLKLDFFDRLMGDAYASPMSQFGKDCIPYALSIASIKLFGFDLIQLSTSEKLYRRYCSSKSVLFNAGKIIGSLG